MRESREDFNFKLNALIDLQLENEVGIRELKTSSVKEWEAIKELRQSSTELRRASEKLRRASEELRQASQSQLTRIENLKANSEMKILIAGGPGFVGSHLADKLIGQGMRSP